jgi:hypothetical protein
MNRIIEHFTSQPLSFEFDPNSNPAELILDVCVGSTIKRTNSDKLSMNSLKNAYDASEYGRKMQTQVLQSIQASQRESKDNNNIVGIKYILKKSNM